MHRASRVCFFWTDYATYMNRYINNAKETFPDYYLWQVCPIKPCIVCVTEGGGGGGGGDESPSFFFSHFSSLPFPSLITNTQVSLAWQTQERGNAVGMRSAREAR